MLPDLSDQTLLLPPCIPDSGAQAGCSAVNCLSGVKGSSVGLQSGLIVRGIKAPPAMTDPDEKSPRHSWSQSQVGLASSRIRRDTGVDRSPLENAACLAWHLAPGTLRYAWECG